MQIHELTPDISVAGQISRENIPAIADLGFRSVVCNRPDGESLDQPPVETIRSAASEHGLEFAFLPVNSGSITRQNAEDFRAVLAGLPRPVLAYCRSGTRCRNLWMLTQA